MNPALVELVKWWLILAVVFLLALLLIYAIESWADRRRP